MNFITVSNIHIFMLFTMNISLFHINLISSTRDLLKKIEIIIEMAQRNWSEREDC